MKENETNIPGVENISNPEEAAKKEIEHARVLASCVSKVNVFGKDNDDEFNIIRENGTTEGIFKTWAVPIIPFIESGELDDLADTIQILPEGETLTNILPENLLNKIENWSDSLSKSPTKLWQTLEKFRVEAQVVDRRLSEIFEEIPLSEEPHERVAQLLARMHVAFGYAAPFYHIEAMVGDGKDTPLNPAHLNGENGGGGALDVVALALPSALPSGVSAERLNWNSLSWDKIQDRVQDLPKSEKEIVLRLSGLLDVSPSDILFAANVLEFIPVSVGGKKGDLPQEEALNLIKSSLNNKPASKGAVVRDTNALIRFMNWFPSIHTQDNFDKGTLWSYAAVCDTASELLNEVTKHNDVFAGNFGETFKEKLSDQLSHLDATSAKGRFLFSLLKEGRFKDDIVDNYKDEMIWLTEKVGTQIALKKQTEAIVDVLTPMPRAIVGGKAAGLAEAAMVLPKENFVEGKVVVSEWVKDWIMSDSNISAAIELLDNQTDSLVRQFWGTEIQRMVQRLPVPSSITNRLRESFEGENLLCVRSSSFDEDTQVNGSAAGIYDSEIGIQAENIDQAIQNVVSSFFSEKALAYRELHGFADVPTFALLVTPFHEGPGGVLFSEGNGQSVNIEVGASPQDIVDASAKRDLNTTHMISSINKENLTEFALTLENIRGSNIDMEFVEDKGKLILLQARALRKSELSHNHSDKNDSNLTDVLINSLGELSDMETNENSMLRLHLGDEINIDQFQGDLFRWLVKSKGHVSEIVLNGEIPATSHFANICLHLGISLKQSI